MLRIGGSQCLAASVAGNVQGQRDAMPQRAELLGRGIAGGRLACRDVDACALGQKAGRDHASDATRTTSDEGGAAFE